jgi:hypothetical protein
VDIMRAVGTAMRGIVNGGAAGSALGSQFYRLYAPQNTSPPFAIYWPVTGGAENKTPKDSEDLMYAVKVVAHDIDTAGSIAALIETSLKGSEASWVIPGWHVYRVTKGNFVEYEEQTAGVPFFHSGAYYHIRLSKDS